MRVPFLLDYPSHKERSLVLAVGQEYGWVCIARPQTCCSCARWGTGVAAGPSASIRR
jgi:hypothetical protein